MPDEHKRVVVDMLAGYDIPLIEDDLYGDLFLVIHVLSPARLLTRRGLFMVWCGI